MLHEKIVMMF